MDNHQESVQYWSSLLQSLADSSSKNNLYPEISSPIAGISTPMTIDEPAEPSKVLGNEDKEAAVEKGKEKEEGAKEDTKTLSKRPRGKEACSINDKRRRTDIKHKVDKLKELTRCHSKKDLFSTLEAVVDKGYPYGPMMPLGMGMDFPGSWTYPYAPPNHISPNYFMPFNHFTPGETSGSGNQNVPYTSQFQPPSQPTHFHSLSQPSHFQPLSQPHFQPPSQPSHFQLLSPPLQFQPPHFQPQLLKPM